MSAFFITGTDTDCGKTYATCALIRYYQAQGKRVKGLKPVATGCAQSETVCVSEDARLIADAEGNQGQVSYVTYHPPISPHLAAESSGVSIQIEDLHDFCTPFMAQYDTVLIEGAGGLMVPLNARETWVDFIRRMEIPVIVIVGMRLGCINHALLTVTAIQHYGLSCAGWIANCHDAHMEMLSENIEALSQRIEKPLLGVIPFNGAYQIKYDVN